MNALTLCKISAERPFLMNTYVMTAHSLDDSFQRPQIGERKAVHGDMPRNFSLNERNNALFYDL
uniref:Uncharacterized protein n=1 Tax=Ascaris lumbricoides TaxID=6252 RepID=A0A0M3IIY1_ASCLU